MHFTSNCRVKCDSIEKRRNYRLFNITANRFFSIKNINSSNSTNSITTLKQRS